jgi:hypothetical protein
MESAEAAEASENVLMMLSSFWKREDESVASMGFPKYRS